MSRPAMILAAGFGTRMGDLVKDRPKPLLPVAGKSLLDHALTAAGESGPVVVNGHYHADQIEDYLSRHHPDAKFSHETPDIRDSGGAIKQALPLLGDAPVLTLNADAVWDGPSPAEILNAAWDPERMSGLMLLVPLSRAIGRQGGGDMAMEADGRLSWDKSPTGWVYTGAQILKTDGIAAYPQDIFSLYKIWEPWMGEGRLFGVVYPGAWADVGHPEGLVAAEKMLAHA